MLHYPSKIKVKGRHRSYLCLFFAVAQSYAEGDPNSWIDGLVWQCTRKVIRPATVSNPSKYKALPLSDRLNGKGETLTCVAQYEDISTWQLPAHRTVLILCSLWVFVCVCVSVIKADLLLCVCVVFVFTSGIETERLQRLAACVQCALQSKFQHVRVCVFSMNILTRLTRRS